jgi:hypothetical protein
MVSTGSKYIQQQCQQLYHLTNTPVPVRQGRRSDIYTKVATFHLIVATILRHQVACSIVRWREHIFLRLVTA